MIVILNLISLQLVKHGYTQTKIYHLLGYQHINIIFYNYNFYHVDRKGKKGGGVALYINNEYKVSDNLSFTITDNAELITTVCFS